MDETSEPREPEPMRPEVGAWIVPSPPDGLSVLDLLGPERVVFCDSVDQSRPGPPRTLVQILGRALGGSSFDDLDREILRILISPEEDQDPFVYGGDWFCFWSHDEHGEAPLALGEWVSYVILAGRDEWTGQVVDLWPEGYLLRLRPYEDPDPGDEADEERREAA